MPRKLAFWFEDDMWSTLPTGNLIDITTRVDEVMTE